MEEMKNREEGLRKVGVRRRGDRIWVKESWAGLLVSIMFYTLQNALICRGVTLKNIVKR